MYVYVCTQRGEGQGNENRRGGGGSELALLFFVFCFRHQPRATNGAAQWNALPSRRRTFLSIPTPTPPCVVFCGFLAHDSAAYLRLADSVPQPALQRWTASHARKGSTTCSTRRRKRDDPAAPRCLTRATWEAARVVRGVRAALPPRQDVY